MHKDSPWWLCSIRTLNPLQSAVDDYTECECYLTFIGLYVMVKMFCADIGMYMSPTIVSVRGRCREQVAGYYTLFLNYFL